MIIIKLIYIVEDDKIILKQILRSKLHISSRLITKLKLAQKIYVNDTSQFINYIVHKGDVITVDIDFVEEDFIVPQEMDLDIIYEDEYILAINKPFGIVVHPSANHLKGTLANGVKFYLHNNKKIRPINRLDRDTSGIVLFAKNEYIQEYFNSIEKIKKEYLAIVNGIIEKSGTINAPMARKQGSIMERCIDEAGQTAITHYKIQQYLNNLTVLKIILETGRTHQIRVHMAHIGHPLLGDTLYGERSNLINRQALHAYEVCFIHPITNKKIEIIASVPEDMKKII